MTQLVGTVADGPPTFIKSYSHARKLFQLGRRAGAMTFGLGNVGDHSIEGLVREFRQDFPEDAPIGDMARGLFDFIEPRWRAVVGPDPSHLHALGFCVVGYSPGASFAEIHEFVLSRDSAPLQVSREDDFGLIWRGVDTPLIRLIKGFDMRLVSAMESHGMSPEQILESVQSLEWFLMQPGMPMQDAVNLVEYLLRTTVGLSSFVDPNPTCGGPLQVAAILPDRGFVWMSQPELSFPT